MKAILQGCSTVDENKTQQSWVIRPGQKFVIGRSPSCQIQIEDRAVSRRHAEVELAKNGLLVVDLGSRNGTFAGDRRVTTDGDLVQHGERLLLGDHKLVVFMEGLEPPTQRMQTPVVPFEYELLGQIGKGATGNVYAVKHRLLGRITAVKVQHHGHGKPEDLGSRERFLREARILCRISSPYVVSVLDLKEVAGRMCLIMELVNGVSAYDRLRAGQVPVATVLDLGMDVAWALESTHRIGVVHRDVKPANVLITPEGLSKLTDFGLARFLSPRSKEEEDLTPLGEGVGTLQYSSPEQVREARLVDARSDIWGLGATLYHLLAGRTPYEARDLDEVMEKHKLEPAPLSPLRHDLPLEVAAFVHSMLQHDPGKRPQDAATCAAVLGRLRKKFCGEREGQEGDLERTGTDMIPVED
jgi:serine/threonine protein kinase